MTSSLESVHTVHLPHAMVEEVFAALEPQDLNGRYDRMFIVCPGCRRSTPVTWEEVLGNGNFDPAKWYCGGCRLRKKR